MTEWDGPEAYGRLWQVFGLTIKLNGLNQDRLLRLSKMASLVFQSDKFDVAHFCAFAQQLDAVLTGECQVCARECMLSILDRAIDRELEEADAAMTRRSLAGSA